MHGFEGGEGSGRRGSAVLLLHQAVAKSGAKDRPPAPLAEGIVAEIRYTETAQPQCHQFVYTMTCLALHRYVIPHLPTSPALLCAWQPAHVPGAAGERVDEQWGAEPLGSGQ